MSETTECPTCGESYKSLGCHWFQSPVCDHPPLNETQKGVIQYFYEECGFGHVRIRDNWANPNLQFGSRSKEVIEEIQQHLSWLAGEVEKELVNGKGNWKVRTRTHPWLMRYVGESPAVGEPVVVELYDIPGHYRDRWGMDE